MSRGTVRRPHRVHERIERPAFVAGAPELAALGGIGIPCVHPVAAVARPLATTLGQGVEVNAELHETNHQLLLRSLLLNEMRATC
jgi:hypothetical protein